MLSVLANEIINEHQPLILMYGYEKEQNPRDLTLQMGEINRNMSQLIHFNHVKVHKL